MIKSRAALLMAVSTLALGCAVAPAEAAMADQAVQSPAAGDDFIAEIVVTARRRSESLQDVPQSVTAITSENVEKLNLRRTEDLVSVVPGLTLSSGGTDTTASLRGASIDFFSGASPTVDLYLNETGIDAGTLFSALYDIGQIEVLRGPQGTARGRTAPSGAITVGTRKANLDDHGGYANISATNQKGYNLQGAFGAPIITDRLAIRLAGAVDRDQGNYVQSVFGGISPRRLSKSGRISVSAKPVDALRIDLTYQHNEEARRMYSAVEGSGSAGGVGLPAAGFNGPRLTAADRRSVQQAPGLFDRVADLAMVSADLDLPGHRLSYVGGYQDIQLDNAPSLDIGNFITHRDIFQTLSSKTKQTTHEVRLASNRSGGFIDYVVGAYFARSTSDTDVYQPAAFLAGAFGSPAARPVTLGTYNDRYVLNVATKAQGPSSERSFFGTITAHLSSKTELTVGGRSIRAKLDRKTISSLTSGTIAIALPFPCAFAGMTSTYAGYCDAAVPAPATPVSSSLNKQTKTPFVYSVALAHRVSSTLNLYANLGTSWRSGPVSIGIANAGGDATLRDLTFLRPEKSTAYEVGAKTTLFDRRVNLNVAMFRQDFQDFITRLPPTPYLSFNGAVTEVGTNAFTANADAKVTGFDIEVAAKPLPGWSLSGALSYADGQLKNALIPCRDSNFDGTPDLGTPTVAQFQAAGKAVALCRSSRSTSRDALWSANLQTEYARSFGTLDGYVRGLVNYRPDNPRQDANFTVDGYALVNLYAGVRGQDGAWDLGVFAKNALNTGNTLGRSFQPTESVAGSAQYFGTSGYYETSYTPPREIGISLRYAFGAR